MTDRMTSDEYKRFAAEHPDIIEKLFELDGGKELRSTKPKRRGCRRSAARLKVKR